MTVNVRRFVCSSFMLTHHPDLLRRFFFKCRKGKWLTTDIWHIHTKQLFLPKTCPTQWFLVVGKAAKCFALRSAGQYLHLAEDQFQQSTGNHHMVGEGSLSINARKQIASKGNFPGLSGYKYNFHLIGILLGRTWTFIFTNLSVLTYFQMSDIESSQFSATKHIMPRGTWTKRQKAHTPSSAPPPGSPTLHLSFLPVSIFFPFLLHSLWLSQACAVSKFIFQLWLFCS